MADIEGPERGEGGIRTPGLASHCSFKDSQHYRFGVDADEFLSKASEQNRFLRPPPTKERRSRPLAIFLRPTFLQDPHSERLRKDASRARFHFEDKVERT